MQDQERKKGEKERSSFQWIARRCGGKREKGGVLHPLARCRGREGGQLYHLGTYNAGKKERML